MKQRTDRPIWGIEVQSHVASQCRQIDEHARSLTNAGASSTFVVSPSLDYWKGARRLLPKASLDSALRARWEKTWWHDSALKEKNKEEEAQRAEIVCIAEGDREVCYPHVPKPPCVAGVSPSPRITEKELADSDVECDMGDDDYDLFQVLKFEDRMQHGFVQCIVQAWCNHLPLVLKPDYFWLLILQGISHHVSLDPQSLRSKLLARQRRASERKIDLLVETNC